MKNYRQYVEQNASKKDHIPESVTSQLLYPTGFMYLDYINGSETISYDEEERPCGKFHNIGITNGSLNIIIGKSHVGKTTIAVKMAVGIVETWMNSVVMDHMGIRELNKGVDIPAPLIHYVDVEKTMSADYVKKMSGYRNKELKQILELIQASTYEDVQKALKWHCKYKEENLPKIKMPQCDVYGNNIVNYPPTIMIIDSATQINSEDSDSAEDDAYEHATQLTAGARRAQMIGKLNTMLVNVAKKYNIIVFEISHINQAPQMSMVPQAKQYRALKQGEVISGGEKQLYLANSILRLDPWATIGTEKASMKNFGEGVTGFIAQAQFIKSKSNNKSSHTLLCYTDDLSYDPFISTIYQAMQLGDIQKAGNFYALDAYPEHKFTIKNAIEVFAEHPQMIPALYDQLRDKLTRYLSTSGRDNNDHSDDDAVITDPFAGIELF